MKKFLCAAFAVALLFVVFPPNSQKASILRQIRSEDPIRKRAAIEAAGASRIGGALPILLEILEKGDDDDYVTYYAVQSIGRLGTPRAIIPLLSVVNAQTLSQVGWETIVRALRRIDPNWVNRPEVQILYPALYEEFFKTRNKKRQEFLFHCLFRIDLRRSEELVIHALTDRGKYNDLLDDVMEKIEELRNPRFIDPLMNYFLADCTGWVPQAVVHNLDLLNADWRNAPAMQRHADELDSRLSAADNLVEERGAVEKLAAIRPRAAVKFFLKIAGNSTLKNYLRCRVMEELAEMRCQEALPFFIDGLKGNSDLRRTCIRGLGKLGNQKSVKHLAALLQNSDQWIQRNAISALAESGTDEARRVLTKKFQNDCSGNEVELIQALLSLREPKAFDWGREILGKASDSLRFRMIELLMPFWNQNDFKEIINYYRLAEKWDKHERILWIKTLAALKDTRALPVLEEANRDENRNVRAHAEWAIFHITH